MHLEARRPSISSLIPRVNLPLNLRDAIIIVYFPILLICIRRMGKNPTTQTIEVLLRSVCLVKFLHEYLPLSEPLPTIAEALMIPSTTPQTLPSISAAFIPS
ncbi:unnamed protein product [Brugia pahangi]|uniref:Uncharacterized protein n=1 Tax=Brugia pahangi TaxID=6280 RepID=A0A0N4T0N9_BRUPA|nr:unnamed protein product [Brugia pahangi]